MSNLVIGVSSVAGGGKDTFFVLLQKSLLKNYLPTPHRFALADELKNELKDWIWQHYGIDIWNCSREDKEKVRPLLVFHGNYKRERTNGRHWIDIIDKKINLLKDSIICCTDIRYCDFDGAEAKWIQEDHKGILVHVSQHTIIEGQKVYKLPPNQVEAYFDPKMKARADYLIDWPFIPAANFQEQLQPYVDDFVVWLIKHGKL